MSDFAYSSAAEIARKIRQREISSREAVDYFLARVEALDKRTNCVVTIDAERARREADAADAALARGEGKGPLHGVPMTIKDSFQTAGMRTTSGAPELATFVTAAKHPEPPLSSCSRTPADYESAGVAIHSLRGNRCFPQTC